jgi:aminoglycoside phosphotransferase
MADRGSDRTGDGVQVDKLTTLATACDPEAMQVVLQRLLPEWGTLAAVGVDILRRRRRRCVMRYRLQFEPGGRPATLIGKVYRRDRGVPVHALMLELLRHGFGPDTGDGIAIPVVAAYLPELSLLLQEEVGGVPVKECIGTPSAESAVRQMAAAVAKLHGCPLRPGPPRGLDEHLSRCRPAPHVLQETVPEIRAAVDEILATTTRLLRERPVAAWALVHGDLHLAQAHVADSRIWLIDLDNCGVADPAADIGNVLAFLQAKTRRDGRLRGAFLDAYFARMPADILDRVPIYEALTCLRQACKRMRLQEYGWRRKACKLVADGVRHLEGA